MILSPQLVFAYQNANINGVKLKCQVGMLKPQYQCGWDGKKVSRKLIFIH